MIEPLLLFFIGALGVIIHSLIKVKKLIEDAKKANLEFSFLDYLQMDWHSILISFLTVILWLFLFEETLKIYPKLSGFVRISFAFMGMGGSYLVQSLLSASKKWINQQIDLKTDELDRLKI